jgi:hypothetical protein
LDYVRACQYPSCGVASKCDGMTYWITIEIKFYRCDYWEADT